ncbi:glycerol-3-phosphate dehydrogenase/oxidase [Oceanomicrobium pacificus]|uniref:FAD-dependent oxidoreductase n=1 Tax=Oceanomicrobium pacificus TaxID=2692916 RepID=A0A6B0TIZ7_9RHOB|nr:glycerol-3-phosphate dehydrogenase/oxidase [Oceanomicrobium pacificus]MXU64380.1 FAD-dependent oxidoreductase [Oceanomicrobium pacificus]
MSDTRQDRIDRIDADGAFDVVVVGGGVNGIGVYRDLALQGLRVLLVERNDFSSGCSAAPSRMIHGGLRYLENGEFDLVRESLGERDALLRNAAHMVRPLPTVIPVASYFSGLLNAPATFFGWTDRPSARGAVPIKFGLALYDWVTRKRRMLPPHRFLSAAKARARWPELTRDLRLAAIYHDAWISHPERLCIEMVQDMETAAPDCVALNYAELQPDGAGYMLLDRQTGNRLALQPRAIVNATGAWLDATRAALGAPEGDRMVSGTKGSHLILDNPALHDALAGHMVYFENADGRVCIVFPYLGRVLAGSTDIRVRDASRVRCEPEELDYILDSLRLIFPGLPIDAGQVVFSFSGIRPLPKSDHDFTGRISRGHYTRKLDGPVPQFCMVGGKWTTFRAFAEQTSDEVLATLGRDRLVSTRDRAIGGGAGYNGDTEAHLAETGTPPARAAALVARYGARAGQVRNFCASMPDDAPLAPDCAYTEAEIVWLIRHEFVESLSDIILRRTDLAITGAVSAEIIARAGAILARERGISPSDLAAQSETLIGDLETYHGVSRDTLNDRNKERRLQCV